MYLFQPNTNHAEGTRPYLHKSMKQFITLICAGLLMNSCATIFCGSKTKVTFDGEISEKATLTIDGMKHTNVTFPYTTKIRRGFDETVVKIESPNYTAEPIIINKSFNAVSVINLLDILGWGIDAATGAITKPEFKVTHSVASFSDRSRRGYFPSRRGEEDGSSPLRTAVSGHGRRTHHDKVTIADILRQNDVRPLLIGAAGRIP